jgi:hypothetical protein
MKKFLVRLLLFILPPVVLLYPADYFISKNYAKSGTAAHGELQVWNDIYNGNVNAEVAVYGSSRAWVHIDPKALGDSLNTTAYNLGIDGHNMWLQYYRHKQLLKYNAKPKYILLSLDVFSLFKTPEGYNAEQFLPYALYNKDLAAYTKGHEDFSQWDYYIPLIRYAGYYQAITIALKNAVKPDTVSARRRGYEPQDRAWTDDFANAQEQMAYFDAPVDPKLLQLLKKFVAECKRDGIQLVFINTPEYIEGQKFVRNRKAVLQLFAQYAKEQNILFLDYSNCPLCYRQDYFYNASHLNKKGSQLFTQQLISDLKKNVPGIVNTQQ